MTRSCLLRGHEEFGVRSARRAATKTAIKQVPGIMKDVGARIPQTLGSLWDRVVGGHAGESTGTSPQGAGEGHPVAEGSGN